jgi:hypothetical protein
MRKHKSSKKPKPRGPKKLRLRPQLVPKPLWVLSACQLLKRAEWELMRQEALAAAGHECEICAAAPISLTCHEVWDYDERKGTATLVRLEIHCTACDTATHIGRAMAHGFGELAIAQLCKVNGITREQAQVLYEDAKLEWRKRNRKKWHVVVGVHLLTRYPQLAKLHGVG